MRISWIFVIGLVAAVAAGCDAHEPDSAERQRGLDSAPPSAVDDAGAPDRLPPDDRATQTAPDAIATDAPSHDTGEPDRANSLDGTDGPGRTDGGDRGRDGSGGCSDKVNTCGPGLTCDLDQPNRCGASTTLGTCIVKPGICTLIYDPVCGCDGRTYGNDCARQQAGIQLDHTGECGRAPGVKCGDQVCGRGELCMHECRCGGAAPSCDPAPDAGSCPIGWTPCNTVPENGRGCMRGCTNPPPRCVAPTATCAGMRVRDGQIDCSCPP